MKEIKRTYSFSSSRWLNYLILLTMRLASESRAYSSVSFGWILEMALKIMTPTMKGNKIVDKIISVFANR